MLVLAKGGCGLVGSAVIRHLLQAIVHSMVSIDRLTGASSLDALEGAVSDARHALHRVVTGEPAAAA